METRINEILVGITKFTGLETMGETMRMLEEQGYPRTWTTARPPPVEPEPFFWEKYGSEQTGTPFIPKTGPYILHRGEEVISAGNRGKSGSMTINMSPTINIARISNDYDVDRLVSRITESVKHDLRGMGVSS